MFNFNFNFLYTHLSSNSVQKIQASVAQTFLSARFYQQWQCVQTKTFALLLMLFAFTLVSCKKEQPKSSTNPYFQADSILKERAAKDTFWREGETSPLLAADKALFQGLTYFSPNETYCIVAALRLATKPDTVQMQTSDNELRAMLRSGTAHFVIGKDSCALAVYRYTGIEGKMQQGYFVPFKDATNGTDTYRPGRYVEGIPLGANQVLLDFNRAYNPYCNYNEQYSCPLVPRENTLALPIEAGEKIYFHPRK